MAGTSKIHQGSFPTCHSVAGQCASYCQDLEGRKVAVSAAVRHLGQEMLEGFPRQFSAWDLGAGLLRSMFNSSSH